MQYNSQKHDRDSIRLHGYDYAQVGFYFVTICTHNREMVFGKIANGLNLRKYAIIQKWIHLLLCQIIFMELLK